MEEEVRGIATTQATLLSMVDRQQGGNAELVTLEAHELIEGIDLASVELRNGHLFPFVVESSREVCRI